MVNNQDKKKILKPSPLQGRLAVLTVTVCQTAGHYGEEYDD